MVLLKSIWALLVIGSQVRGIPLPNNRHADMKMTAQSHPMLASVFSTANNANMIDFSNKQFEVQKATKDATGGWPDGTPDNRDGFMDISNRIGDIKDIPRNRGAEFGTGFHGHVEKTRMDSLRHAAKGIERVNGGKKIPEDPRNIEPSIAIIDTLSGGICAYCQQTQNITCMQKYCLKDAPAVSRDVMLSNTVGDTGSPIFTAIDAPVSDIISHQHLHPSDSRPMKPLEVLPRDVQPRPDFVPIDTARLLPVAPEFPFPNRGVQHPGNTGSAILPIAPETPFTNIRDPNPSTIDAAITDVNSFMQGQLPVAPEFPFSNMGVPHSGNERPMLPVAPENPFVNVGAPNPSVMEAAVNDANAFQRGNADPNAISFDNEFRQSDTQAAPNTGIIPQRPNVVPGDRFSFDTVFQQANGLRPVDPASRTHTQPSDLMPNNNQQPSFDFVQFEAMRPFEGLQGNGIVNNIRNQDLADIPVDVHTSVVPINVPSARPFDAMNPLTGIHEVALPQGAGNRNNVQPIVPNVAVVSAAQDFFALKPHSRITGMQRHTPVTANEFLLNDMGQPIQTFAELNKKINDLHLTEHRSSNLFIQAPVQSDNSPVNVRPAMVGQAGVVQTSTVLPTAVTIVTKSPQRKAELNALSKTFLTEIVL